ncbi:MAG: LamG domain-containing protein [Planctomycetota bacterium]
MFDIHGPVGGPFPQGTRTYSLTNVGDELLVWQLDTVYPWLISNPVSGYLAAGASTDVTVEIDQSQASQLAVGSYPANLILRSRSNEEGEISLAFQLSVDPAPSGALSFSPDDELFLNLPSTGTTAQDGSITVNNSGAAGIEWEAWSQASWLTVEAPANTWLAPGEQQTLGLFVDENLLQSDGLTSATTAVTLSPVGDPTSSHDITVHVTLTGGDSGRVTAGLVAEYHFDEGAGTTVHDVSGQSPAMDLVIENPAGVQWLPSGLSVTSPTLIASPGAATRINSALQAAGEMTVEAWIRPDNLNQDGPARIVTISNGPSLRNFTLGQGLWGSQARDTYNMRLRSTQTDLDGMPMLTSGAGVATTGLQHVVYTRRTDGQARLFVDGQVVCETNVGGNLGNWDSSYRMALAGEIGASRPWLGELHLVAVYQRALEASEIQQNLLAGSGAQAVGQLSVSPSNEVQITAVVGQTPTINTNAYQVANIGQVGLDWTASVDQNWVSLGQSSGSLASGQSGSVGINMNPSAIANLPVGVYFATAHFENTTSEYGSTDRSIRLTVQQAGQPSTGDRPGPSNTGPTNPGILSNVSGMTITQDGYVLENVRVSGTIDIQANNVTIRNFIVDGGGSSYGIRATGGNYGIVIEDGEVLNVASAGVYGGGFHASRLNIHESGGDGMKCTNDVLVEGCWVHHLGTAPGAHADCNQTRGGSNFIFRGNYMDLPIDIGEPYKQNAAFIMQTGEGPVDNVLIEDNWLNGGNFTVYIVNKWTPGSSLPNYGDPTNCRLIGNRFMRDYRYGVLNTSGYVEISGNVWDDDGTLMDINNQ